ncbi:nucleotidyltransferase domain-containing protein [Candidatus Woesearchaeota archaeon]|nr:nucleotidyltransferase domain-containing protein [Candidatus Woesearchaeota archaeon]
MYNMKKTAIYMNKTSIYEDTENKILGNLLRTPLESKSMHQIASETSLSYVTVFKIIPILLKKELIKLEKKGMSSLISVNLEKADISKLSSAVLYEKRQFLRKHLDIYVLLNNITEKLADELYVLVLFGSYAKGTNKESSDIDLLFIVSKKENTNRFKEKINKVFGLFPQKIDYNVVVTESYMAMLNEKYTVGWELFRHGLVLFGAEQYYSMVKEYVRTKGY